MRYFKTSTKHVDGITAHDTKVEHRLQTGFWLNHHLLFKSRREGAGQSLSSRLRAFALKLFFEATGEKCSSSRAIMTRGITLREPSGGGSNRINEETAVRK